MVAPPSQQTAFRSWHTTALELFWKVTGVLGLCSLLGNIVHWISAIATAIGWYRTFLRQPALFIIEAIAPAAWQPLPVVVGDVLVVWCCLSGALQTAYMTVHGSTFVQVILGFVREEFRDWDQGRIMLAIMSPFMLIVYLGVILTSPVMLPVLTMPDVLRGEEYATRLMKAYAMFVVVLVGVVVILASINLQLRAL